MADRIDREGVLAGHQIVHIVLAGVQEEERQTIAMDGDLGADQEVHRIHRAAGKVNDLEVGREERHSLAAVGKVAVVGMAAVVGEDTAGRSPAGNIRNS